MPLYTVLTQQWEPGRRTVDANLKSGTIEVLQNPQPVYDQQTELAVVHQGLNNNWGEFGNSTKGVPNDFDHKV